MTPQLQQAIRLLQLSALELQQEVQDALESNLMLEVDEEKAVAEPQPEPQTDKSELEVSADHDTIPDDLPVDTDWSSIYDGNPVTSSSPAADSDRSFEQNLAANGISLREHLAEQLTLATLNDNERIAATHIIDALDEDGYLRISLAELLEELFDQGINSDDIEGGLIQVQEFDPVGVGARDLRECLLLQLKQEPSDDPIHHKAIQLVDQHFDALSNPNRVSMKQLLEVSDEELNAILELIRSLNPRPGGAISKDNTEYVEPDVVVDRLKGRWQVRLNDANLPRLRINATYASLIQRGNQSQDNQTMRDHLQEARWLLKSLESRHDTLLRVAECIVKRQLGFFEFGPEAMRPMVMRELADELDIHESTISRATTRKYMLTPRGVFELKYFFSSHVSTDTGGECSATAIRAMIKKMIQGEEPSKPLSDNKITAQLKDQGIAIARRTVAKYRESMAIPSSSDRKRLI